MKVDSSKPAMPAQSPVSGGPLKAADPAAPATGAPGDTVRLQSRPAADNVQPYDRERIAELRSAIAEGRYQPNAVAIADVMLNIEQAFEAPRGR